MRSACWIVLTAALAACSGDDGGSGSGAPKPHLRVSTRFDVTSIEGTGTSPFDALQDQTIDFDIVWAHASFDTPPDVEVGCRSSLFGFETPVRTAYGSSADVVQSEILDPLGEWLVGLSICEPPGDPPRVGFSAIDAERRVSFVCDGFPESAQKMGEQGPILTTFTATQCKTEIEYLPNGRKLTSPSVSILIETGPAQLP